MGSYFNFRHHIGTGPWGRKAFIANWRGIAAGDPFRVPPFYPLLNRALDSSRNPHLKRLGVLPVYSQALFRPVGTNDSALGFAIGQGWPVGMAGERPVAVALVLIDPRRTDGAVTLALLKTANDGESLERFLYFLLEELAERNCRRVIGPTGISPHLGSGALLDGWNHIPPIFSPSNPPYFPDILSKEMTQIQETSMLVFDLASTAEVQVGGPAVLEPLDPKRLASDLLPLLRAAVETPYFPAPDRLEAEFLLEWTSSIPRWGWLAEVDGRPAGFALVGPDTSRLLQKSGGARTLAGRLFYSLLIRRGGRRVAPAGRLIFFGVDPQYRGRGVGGQLIQRVLVSARRQGWLRLSAGPFPEDSPGAASLENFGALPQQRYGLFEWGF